MSEKMSKEQRAVWERITRAIEASPSDGISAEGRFSEDLLASQRAYIKGLRSARLYAVKALGYYFKGRAPQAGKSA